MARRLRFLSFFYEQEPRPFREEKSPCREDSCQKIGHLKVEVFPPSSFENLPTQAFNAHKVIRAKDELFVTREGIVEIWNPHQDMLVTELRAGTIFWEMSLLDQSMYECQAIAGSGGATLGVMDLELIAEWIKENPLRILEEIGPRLILIEAEHYRAVFQTIQHRLAGFLLELAGEDSVVGGTPRKTFQSS